MFDLDKKAQSEVIDELLSFLNERGKGKLEKMFASPEDVLGKGKVNVSEKTFVIPLGKKKEDEEDENKEENKESLSDDVHHFEDIYKDNFDNVDNDDPYDEKFQKRKEKYLDEKDEEDEDELSLKEKKLLKLLNRM